MSITSAEPTRITLMDQAVMLYHSKGQNFLDLLDPYLSNFPETEYYTFFGPDYIMLGRKETDEQGDYWHVDYAAGDGLKVFLRLMPYRLDRIGFHRYFKYSDRSLRFLDTAKLLKHYGIISESSAATSTSTAATAASDSCGSSPDCGSSKIGTCCKSDSGAA